jgi:hypothetical protein
MLASKVLLAILDELLSDPTPEALETLAALLTVVGPTFDGPGWAYHVAFNAIFEQVKKITLQSSTESRVRCLLKDVLDLRSAGWRDRKPKKIEGPTTLEGVALQKAREEGSPMVKRSQSEWDHVPSRSVRGPVAAPPPQPKPRAKFDRAGYRNEVEKTLRELRVSHDAQDAAARLAEVVPPQEEQPAELCDFLGNVAQEGSADVRKVGFEVVAALYLKGHWKSEIATGLKVFLSETCPDLKYDVPALSRILRDELHPGLASLVRRGLLSASKHDTLLKEI